MRSNFDIKLYEKSVEFIAKYMQKKKRIEYASVTLFLLQSFILSYALFFLAGVASTWTALLIIDILPALVLT